jgi:hypothetical protein
MKIETGEPRETGHYVCWLPGVGIPTVIRFWLAGGHGWLNNLKEPVAGNVAGWLGPLPTIQNYENEGRCSVCGEYAPDHYNYDCNKKPVLEFDL